METPPPAPGAAGADEKALTAVAIAALSVLPRIVLGSLFRPGVQWRRRLHAFTWLGATVGTGGCSNGGPDLRGWRTGHVCLALPMGFSSLFSFSFFFCYFIIFLS
jgi:hypothetical protein